MSDFIRINAVPEFGEWILNQPVPNPYSPRRSEMLYRFSHQIGLWVAPAIRHFWRDPWQLPVQIPIDRDVFIVTSTIKPVSARLSDGRSRSAFSAEERLEQTLESVSSIRTKDRTALVGVIDNSPLQKFELAALQNTADWVLGLADVPQVAGMRDHGNKGVGEVQMLRIVHRIMSPFRYGRLFKLSGRYRLSGEFSREPFPMNAFGFLRRDGVVSTRLYSVPSSLHSLWGRQLTAAYWAARFGVSIESVIAQGLRVDQIQAVEHLGVEGRMADGSWISE